MSSISDVGGTAEAMLRGGQEGEEEDDDNDDGASLVADGRGSHPDNGGVGVDDLSPDRDGRDSSCCCRGALAT